jgi:hypothetical protein
MGGSTKDKEYSKWKCCGWEQQANNNIEKKETNSTTETVTSSILKTSTNYKFNTNKLETPSINIAFSNTTLVAICNDKFDSHMRHTVYNQKPIWYTARPVRSTTKSRQWNPVHNNRNKMKFDRVIYEYERRAEDRFKIKQQQQQQCKSSTNNKNYNILHDDTLEAYGDYHQSWSLDTAAPGHYCGKKTRINNRKKTPTGNIQVVVANNQSMIQSEEGELPFDCLPKAAKDVLAFPTM